MLHDAQALTWFLFVKLLFMAVILFHTMLLLLHFMDAADTGMDQQVACSPPISLSVTVQGGSSATFSWVPTDQEDQWDVAILPLGNPPPGLPTHPALIAPMLTVNSLTPGTAYEFYVRADCGSMQSNWIKYNQIVITHLPNPSACQLDLPIPDEACEEFSITIDTYPGGQMGVDWILSSVELMFEHPWADDLDIQLSAPNGTVTLLSTDNGNGKMHYGEPSDLTCAAVTRLLNPSQPEACSIPWIVGADAPFIGDFLAEGSLNNFNNGGSVNGLWKLKVCDDAQDDIGTLEYVALHFEAINCLAPSELDLVHVDSTFAVLTWEPGGICANAIVEYGPPGFTPGLEASPGIEGMVTTLSCAGDTLFGLAPETDYDIYIRETCGGGMAFSANSCPISLSTLCSMPPSTIVSDFNEASSCDPLCDASCDLEDATWFNTPADAMNWLVFAGPTPTADTGPMDDFPGGGKYLYLESSGCGGNNQAILFSNCLEVANTAAGNCHFSFHYLMYGVNVRKLQLDISLDGGINWIPIWEKTGNQGTNWRREQLNLSAFEGLIVQFRFVGQKGTGTRGDIALDNLVFAGPTDLGPPPYAFYRDQDGDNFGVTTNVIYSCINTPPSGYVPLGGDCNDFSSLIFPGGPETPCDFFDFNCNGDVDEYFLPEPITFSDTVCSGNFGLLKAQAGFFGDIFWYEVPTGGTALDTGFNFVPMPLIENNSDTILQVDFYAEEVSVVGCYSPVRAKASLFILPQPNLLIPQHQFEAACAGVPIHLDQLVIQDLNNTDATYTFHEALPPSVSNRLDPAVVSPAFSRFYYVQAIAEGGCATVDSVWVEVSPSPQIEVTGGGEQCLGTPAVLTADDQGQGVEPLEYLWSTGQNTAIIQPFTPGPSGTSTTYSVTVTGANGCVDSAMTVVEAVSSLGQVGLSTTDVTACGLQNGSMLVSPSGGVPPYEVSWSGTESGSQGNIFGSYLIQNLAQGSYQLTVTDASAAACPFTLPLTLINGPDASVSITQVQDVSCFGGQDGCISLTVDDPEADILWSNDATTPVLCGLAAGNYSVTVSNGVCDNVVGPITVGQPDSLLAKVALVEDAACFGSYTGGINMIVIGGTPPYEFEWSNQASTQNLTNVPAGDYTLTITDANNCILVTPPITVGGVPPLEVTPTVTELPCAGLNSGEIALSVQGGSPPYAYEWNTGSNLPVLEDLGPGTYHVTVTDFEGCLWTETFDLVEPAMLEVELQGAQPASCQGVADGQLAVAVVGGTAPYSYLWSSGDLTATATDLEAGIYAVTITDDNNCSVSLEALEVTAPIGIMVQAAITPTYCDGSTDGAISLQPVTGAIPFEYSWDNNANTATITNLASGVYTVTLTDGLGCTSVQSFEVPAEQPIQYGLSAVPPNCFEGTNGAIFLTPFGGTAPYHFQWSTNAETADLEQIPAGSYVCTVTDQAGCLLVIDTVQLIDPPPIQIELESIDSITCFGAGDGAINVTVSGGLPPYLYTWSSDQLTEDISNLGPDSYTLTVEDDLNCAVTSTIFELTEPALLTVTAAPVDAIIDCTSNSIDTLKLLIEGGTEPYQVEWSNGAQTPYLVDMPSGEYAATVTDAFGCSASIEEVKIPEPAPVLELRLDSTVLFPEDCSNLPDEGVLRVLIDGGYPPYQFNWSHGVQSQTGNDTLFVGGLGEGFYNVTVTDDIGCTVVLSGMEILLPEPLAAFVAPGGISDVNCKYGADGSVNLNVQGGFGGYTYYWINLAGDTVANVQDPNNLSAGTYQAIVQDQFGCKRVIFPITIDQPDSLLNVTFDVVDILCYGQATGSISASIAGGAAPYELEWSNASSNLVINNLAAGTYGLTVEDANNCVLEWDDVEVEAPDAPISIAQVQVENVSCNGFTDGLINITVVGGTPGYSYFWSNNKFTQDIFNLSPGLYDCLIVDNNGCSFQSLNYYVGQPEPLKVEQLIIVPPTVNNADGQATAIVEGGTGPYTLLWSNGDQGSTADSLVSGTYLLSVIDFNGCSLQVEVEIPSDTVDAVGQWSVVKEVLVYPNPTTGTVAVRADLDWEAGALQVWDISGRLWETPAPVRSGPEQVQLDLAQLPTGFYLLSFEHKNQVYWLGKVEVIR